MKKVLILGVAAVQLDAIKTLNDMGYETHAVAMKKDGPGADEADFFSPINFLNVDQVKNYIVKNQIDCVYSTGSDLAMPIVSRISEELNMPHFITEKTAKICNNKNLMRQTLGENFEGNIPFQIIDSVENELQLEFPFILKPTDSQGQRGVHVIHNQADFISCYEDIKQFSRSGLLIAEYFIQGPEISVNGYMVDGELKYMTSSDRKTWPKYLGLIHKHVIPSEINEIINQKMRKILEKIAVKLEIKNGPIYAQVKIENDNPYIIEITPRLDGCHMWRVLEKYEGVNLMKLTFEHLMKGETSELERFRKGTDKLEVEFICQEPHTPADYKKHKEKIDNAEYFLPYYKQDEVIRPINGKFEKIGFVINTLMRVE